MASSEGTKEERAEEGGAAMPARLYALLAGAGLALLGALGFFYDADFGTGADLASDDLAGVLLVNGWRNLIYLISGLLALGFASTRPRAVALWIGALYLVLGLWGLLETERGIGSILDAIPLADRDNALHLVLGGLGLIAYLAEPESRLKLRTRIRIRRRSPA